MHSRKICVLLYRSSRLEVFCKKCALKTSQMSQKNICAAVLLLKKRLQCRCFPASFAKVWRASFLQNTLVVASVILLSWLRNHVQSQQQSNGGVMRSSREAISFGGFQWFLLVCCFSSYTNSTTNKSYFFTVLMNACDWLGSINFFIQSKTARKRLLLSCYLAVSK